MDAIDTVVMTPPLPPQEPSHPPHTPSTVSRGREQQSPPQQCPPPLPRGIKASQSCSRLSRGDYAPPAVASDDTCFHAHSLPLFLCRSRRHPHPQTATTTACSLFFLATAGKPRRIGGRRNVKRSGSIFIGRERRSSQARRVALRPALTNAPSLAVAAPID